MSCRFGLRLRLQGVRRGAVGIRQQQVPETVQRTDWQSERKKAHEPGVEDLAPVEGWRRLEVGSRVLFFRYLNDVNGWLFILVLYNLMKVFGAYSHVGDIVEVG